MAYIIVLKTSTGEEYTFTHGRGEKTEFPSMEKAEERSIDLLDFAHRTPGLKGTELVDIKEI